MKQEDRSAKLFETLIATVLFVVIIFYCANTLVSMNKSNKNISLLQQANQCRDKIEKDINSIFDFSRLNSSSIFALEQENNDFKLISMDSVTGNRGSFAGVALLGRENNSVDYIEFIYKQSGQYFSQKKVLGDEFEITRNSFLSGLVDLDNLKPDSKCISLKDKPGKNLQKPFYISQIRADSKLVHEILVDDFISLTNHPDIFSRLFVRRN